MSYRYIGNKTKLLPFVIDTIQSLTKPGDRVVDLMCGTASVSEALRVNGFHVISADIMTYATYHASVRLLLNKNPAFKKVKLGDYQSILTYLNNLPGVKGYFYKEFSPKGNPKNSETPRQYFSPENAQKIDAINSVLNEWQENGRTTEIENILLRHSLILASNKVANIAGTFGHYRSKWNSSSLAKITLTKAEFKTGFSTDHQILKGRAEDVSKEISADLCYIDPPYMKRQYAANYHILETIARGDSPEAIGKSGLRPWRDQYSDFCSKVRIRDAFKKIFTEMDCPIFLISYSEDGLLKKSELMSFFSKFGKVECKEITYPRFKSNNSPLSEKLSEYIFILKK